MNSRSEYWKQYGKLNRIRLNNTNKQFRMKNPDKYRSYYKTYRLKHKAKVNAKNASRRALQYFATPKWLTKDQKILMEMQYILAAYLTEVTEIKWHVDHIIPLKGSNVTGLHVPWNLRVITQEENLSKFNKVG